MGEGEGTLGAQPSTDWRAALPETYERKGPDGTPAAIPLRGSKTLEKFKDAGSLAQGYIELEQAHSAKTDGLVRIPGADAKPEDVAAYRKALGIPEAAGEYKIDVPDGLRALVPLEMAAKFAPIFHAAHVSPPVAQKIVQAYAEHAQAVMAATQQENAIGREALKKEIGIARYDRDTILTDTMLEKKFEDGTPLFHPEFIALLNSHGLGGNPIIVRQLFQWSEMYAEDGIISGETVNAPTKESLGRRKGEIEADPDFMNKYKNPAKNTLLVAEWNRIFQQLNPEPITR